MYIKKNSTHEKYFNNNYFLFSFLVLSESMWTQTFITQVQLTSSNKD